MAEKRLNISKKRKAVLQLLVLTLICGLIMWHAIHWHSTGMYLEMFKWLQLGRGYVTVLYNLGLMLVMGTALSLLMEKITDLIGHEENAK